jgi:hypothetical protein
MLNACCFSSLVATFNRREVLARVSARLDAPRHCAALQSEELDCRLRGVQPVRYYERTVQSSLREQRRTRKCMRRFGLARRRQGPPDVSRSFWCGYSSASPPTIHHRQRRTSHVQLEDWQECVLARPRLITPAHLSTSRTIPNRTRATYILLLSPLDRNRNHNVLSRRRAALNSTD